MQFDVRALDRSTGVVSLVLEAVSAQAATAQAQQQGLAVLRVRPKGKAGWRLSRGGSNQAFPLGQFSHELLTLLEAGLSVVESVETLREKETKPERQQLLAQLLQPQNNPHFSFNFPTNCY